MHSETLLSLFLPVLPTLLRSYPTGQAERKAARRCAAASFSSECKEVSNFILRRMRNGCQATYMLNLHLQLLPDILALRLSGKLDMDNRGKSKIEIESISQEK
jgi:hypothetical protein